MRRRALDGVRPAPRHPAVNVQLGERAHERSGVTRERDGARVARRLGVATPRRSLRQHDRDERGNAPADRRRRAWPGADEQGGEHRRQRGEEQATHARASQTRAELLVMRDLMSEDGDDLIVRERREERVA